MATNKLTPDQASFEGGITGWEAVANPSQFVNLLTAGQASIETGSTTPGANLPDQWGVWGAGQAIARDPATARHGTSSAILTRSDGAASAAQASLRVGTANKYMPVVPGRLYMVLASFISPAVATTKQQQIGLGIRNASATFLTQAYSQAWIPTDDVWQDRAFLFTPPVGAADTYMLCTTWVGPGGAGAGHLDRVAWYDLGPYVWPGPGQLTAQQGSIEAGSTTFATWTAGWHQQNAATLLARSTTRALDGSSSLAMKVTGGGVAAARPGNSAGGFMATPVVAGRRYRFSFDIWTDEARSVEALVTWQNASAGTIAVGADRVATPAAAGAWTTVVYEYEAPAGATQCVPTMVARTMTTDTSIVYIDRVSFDLAPALPTFVMPGDTGVAIAQGTESAPDGTKVLRVSRTADSGVVEARTTPVAAIVGTRYTGMASLIGPTGSILAGSIYLDFLDGSGNVLVSPTEAITVTDQWAQARVVSAPAPTGTTQVRLRVRVPGVAEAATVRVDKAGVMDAITAQWVPGGATVLASVYVDPDPTRHVVSVAVLNLPAGAVDVQRVLPGGRIESVRNAQNLTPDATNAILFDDYDAPTDTPFTYRVLAHGTTTVRATSDPVTLESLGYFFLADPNTPAEAIRVIPAANAIPQMKRDAPVGVHRVLGRADPVVVTDTRWWASGDLTLYTLTNNQREEVGEMTSLGITLALYGPAEVMGGVGRLYFVAPTVDERRVSARGTETAREWHLDFTQVAAPSTVPVTPPVVTWQDVVDSYATWQDVVNGEVDWLDVMRDVPTTITAPPIGWEW